jgi:hypothetical protein
MGECMGTRAGLDAVVKRKIPRPYLDSNPSPVLYHWAIPTPKGKKGPHFISNASDPFPPCIMTLVTTQASNLRTQN